MTKPESKTACLSKEVNNCQNSNGCFINSLLLASLPLLKSRSSMAPRQRWSSCRCKLLSSWEKIESVTASLLSRKLFTSQELDSHLEDIIVVNSNFKEIQISSAILHF